MAREAKTIPNPTTTEFITAIGELNRRPFGPADQLLIFIAGHGDFKEDSKEGGQTLPSLAHLGGQRSGAGRKEG